MQLIAVQCTSFVEAGVISVDASLPETIRGELLAMGHNVGVNDGLGNAYGLAVEYDTQGEPGNGLWEAPIRETQALRLSIER